jgi:hypothetical protein
MDDHDLGALLDTSVPAQPASEAALTRIHRRAAQRVRRIRFAAAAFTIVRPHQSRVPGALLARRGDRDS